MYLLYLDESGTHAGAPVFVLAGIALHEHDVWYLQRALNRQVAAALRPLSLDPADFELHAQDLRSLHPGSASPWHHVDPKIRRDLLSNAYRAIARFRGGQPGFPVASFGAVVQATYENREERAYELVLNKFDEMLDRLANDGHPRQRGLVLHDVRQKKEQGIQKWTSLWRERAGNVGRINNLADVPVFLDSRATRAVQAADLIAYALWRYYGPAREERFLGPLWDGFDRSQGQMHGLIHVTPAFARNECGCPPCSNRLRAGR